MRRVLILAIVGSWLTLLAALVRKHVPTDVAGVAALPGVELAGRDEWFGIYRDGGKIGHAHRVTRRSDGGYAFFEESVVELAMLGVAQTLRTSLTAETDAGFALRRFRFALISPATVFSASGTSDGRHLEVSYGPQGHKAHLTVPLAEPIYLPSTLRSRVLAGDLTPGTRYRLPAFSPLALQNDAMSITVEGHERLPGPDGPIETVRLSEEHRGIRTRAWLDEHGDVVREEAALGFTLERETREQALAAATSRARLDLATSSRIRLRGRIEEPRRSTRLALRVRGAAASAVPDDPPRQRMEGDLLRITREDLPDATPLAPPGLGPRQPDDDARDERAAALAEALAPHLSPAPFIESDDPEIRTTARAIVGETRDATQAAQRLVAWVHDELAKAPTVTVPSAREVLAARRGDCNEHATLLTAMARAVGIPARMVAGAAYVTDAFYYHAWVELWLGSWVSADGVFGQIPVDATHVKLVDGGLERHVDLAGLIGKLEFAVEEETR